MHGAQADMERMRQARRRLASARQRVRRLSWLARDPESLDADVPLLALPAFLRAVERFQSIRLHREQAALLIMRLDPCHADLRRAVAMHLIENTRNCDTLGCAGDDTFLVLLKGADEAGMHAAAQRLRLELRQLAARAHVLSGVHMRATVLTPALGTRDIMRLLRACAAEGRQESTRVAGAGAAWATELPRAGG